MRSALSLSRNLLEDLGMAIVSGAFDQDRLPNEQALAQRYGVGRVSVREVVKMLVAKGLVYGRSGQGTFVAPETQWSLFDPDVLRWLQTRRLSGSMLIHLTQARLGVEPQAASLAAARITTPMLRALDIAVSRIENADAGGYGLLDIQTAFHLRLLAATGNPLFVSFGSLVTGGLSVAEAFRARARAAPDLGGYRTMLAAMSDGDSAGAGLAMHAIVSAALDLAPASSPRSAQAIESAAVAA